MQQGLPALLPVTPPSEQAGVLCEPIGGERHRSWSEPSPDVSDTSLSMDCLRASYCPIEQTTEWIERADTVEIWQQAKQCTLQSVHYVTEHTKGVSASSDLPPRYVNVGITARKLNILKYSLKNMQFKNMKVYFVVNQFKAAVGLEDFPFFDLFVVFIQSENYWPSRYLSVLFRCQKCYIYIWNVYVYIITPSASDFKLRYQETVYV